MKRCVSPARLLQRYRYRKNIDYLALDTEGSEFEILKAWPWDDYVVGLISIETAEEEVDEISEYLKTKKYTRVVNPFCPHSYETHYCHESLIDRYKFEIVK
jgi:hypothetical protein